MSFAGYDCVPCKRTTFTSRCCFFIIYVDVSLPSMATYSTFCLTLNSPPSKLYILKCTKPVTNDLTINVNIAKLYRLDTFLDVYFYILNFYLLLVYNYTYLLTYLLTPRCRVLLERLTGLQLVKKFPAFHGTRRFIIALTSVCHLSLSWASPNQSIYPHPIYWRSILILSTHLRLGLPSSLFPSGFPTTSTPTLWATPGL